MALPKLDAAFVELVAKVLTDKPQRVDALALRLPFNSDTHAARHRLGSLAGRAAAHLEAQGRARLNFDHQPGGFGWVAHNGRRRRGRPPTTDDFLD